MTKIFFFFQAEDGIRYFHVTGVQTCALPILRRRALRGDAALHPGDPLSLLALPEALRRVRAHSRPHPARAVPAAPGRGADQGLPPRRRTGQSVLLGVRLEPLWELVAGGGAHLRPPRCARRRPEDPPRTPLVRRLEGALGRAPGRRPPALPGRAAPERVAQAGCGSPSIAFRARSISASSRATSSSFPAKKLSYAAMSKWPWPERLKRIVFSSPASSASRATRIAPWIACADSGAGTIPSSHANATA